MKMGIEGKLAQKNVLCFSPCLKPDGIKAMWGGRGGRGGPGGQGGGWVGDAQEDKESRGQNGSARFQGLKVKSVPSGMEGAKGWKEGAGGRQAA